VDFLRGGGGTPFYSYTIFLRKKHDNLELLPDVVLKKIVEMVMK
jgi:hypothetical protein